MTTPCDACPFLKKMRHGFDMDRLREFAAGDFSCHKTCELSDEDEFVAGKNSQACAGMLIFNEKRNQPNQLMRISERLGMYDRTKLNMKAKVR
jgi:hypothetical protein